MSSWSFKPPWWATLSTLVLVACLCGLGTWQLQRGWAKQALLEHYEGAAEADARVLDGDSKGTPAQVERARTQGRYDASRQMLLDNQSHGGRPGYHVVTPLVLADGARIMVDRGWIARADIDNAMADAVPQGDIEVDGLWRALPAPAMRLKVDNCMAGSWPRIVQYPTASELRCLLEAPVADGLLLLSADAPGGYVRQWQESAELTPAKNYGYAAQWFAFALTLFGIYLKLNLRRTP